MARAPRGERTILLHLRFFTDDIATDDGGATGKGAIKKKHALGMGTITTVANKSHGITRQREWFNSTGDMTLAIEKVLVKAGVKLHPYGRNKNLAP